MRRRKRRWRGMDTQILMIISAYPVSLITSFTSLRASCMVSRPVNATASTIGSFSLQDSTRVSFQYQRPVATLWLISMRRTDHRIGSSIDHLEGSAKNVLFTVWFLQSCAQFSTSLPCSARE
jgi:hypothetical protein